MQNRTTRTVLWQLILSFLCLMAQEVTELSPLLISPAEGEGHACTSDQFAETVPHFFGRATESAVLLDWPLGKPLHQETFVLNYYDNDLTGSIFKDYQGNSLVGYSGHNGTDLGLYSFRDMDRGTAILAAADGVVSAAIYQFGDRNYGVPYPDNGNGVFIDHSDGSRTIYWHMRTNSLAVEVGETVHAGQFLGYIGSSGWSPQPHLHLTTRIPNGSGTQARDPFEGPCSPQATLWNSPEPYVGEGNPEIFSCGTFTLTSIGGSLNNIPLELFREHPLAPSTVGREESGLGIWIMIRGAVGSSYSVDLFRPDGSLYSTLNATLGSASKYGWLPWWININGNTTSADFGEWTVSARIGGNVICQSYFQLGQSTQFAPRFWRVGSRSIRISGVVQHDTLRATALAGAVSYQFQNAPDFATLNDSIVTFAATSDQDFRSSWFNVIASNNAGLTDTMTYHVVDPSKPFNPGTAITAAPPVSSKNFALRQNFPNPFNPSTTIEYQLTRHSLVTLTVFDGLGRYVKTVHQGLQPPGIHQQLWDGTDQHGELVASGVFFYKLTVGEQQQIRKMLLVR